MSAWHGTKAILSSHGDTRHIAAATAGDLSPSSARGRSPWVSAVLSQLDFFDTSHKGPIFLSPSVSRVFNRACRFSLSLTLSSPAYSGLRSSTPAFWSHSFQHFPFLHFFRVPVYWGHLKMRHTPFLSHGEWMVKLARSRLSHCMGDRDALSSVFAPVLS